MLDTAFYFALNMSIMAAAIGLVVLVVRRLKMLPRFAAYAMWGLVFIRLIVPFAFTSKASFFNLTGSLVKRVVVVPTPVQDSVSLTTSNAIGAAKSYFPVTYRTDLLERFFGTAALVWVIIAMAALIASFVLYYLTGCELRKAKHLTGNLHVSDMVSSPMVFGVFKQRIIIPSSLAGDEPGLKYVLLHEEVHIRRRDNLWRFVAVCTACVHWFNPLVWLYLRMFLNDMELACDAEAVKLLSAGERKEYAHTLVNYGTGQRVFMSTAFGRSNVKVRVLNVMSYRRLTALAAIVSILFIAAIAAALLTNPMK